MLQSQALRVIARDIEATTNIVPIQPALQARNMSVSYGQRDIIKDVNLSIQPNEVMAIIGPSGCGKSTFIATLNRMIEYTLPEAKVKGDVILQGGSVYDPAVCRRALRNKIGMVFQRPNPFPFSIRKNMIFALKAAGCTDQASQDERIQDSLEAVGLWHSVKDRLKDNATDLSGGEQQRLCIARALISKPDVILFDEPCSALDPISCSVIEELIVQLKESCTLCVVTHNLSQAARISDRCSVFWLQEGSGVIIETNTTERLFNDPQHEKARGYIKGEFC